MWALEIVGFMLLGTVVIVGGVVVGLPYLITKWLGHDQATCDCWDCRGRRHRAVERAKKKGVNLTAPRTKPVRHIARGEEKRDPKDYWSTEELCTGHHVLVKGTVLEITSLRTMPDGNCKVSYVNVLTKVHSFVIITRNMMQMKMWRKGFGHDLWR